LLAAAFVWGAIIAGLFSFSFPWYRADFALRTFRASYLFGGLTTPQLLRGAGRIQYEFYGVSAFWVGREPALFRGLGWFSAFALGCGLILAILWIQGAPRRYVIAGIVLLLIAVGVPAIVVASLSWTMVAPAGEQVSIALFPLPTLWLTTTVTGLLILSVLAEESVLS